MGLLLPVLQSNLIGIILMAITMVSLKKNLRSGILADKLFFMLACSVMLVCSFEILSTVFNGTTFTGAAALNRITNAILFAVNPFPAFLWAIFAHCKIYKSERKLKRAYKILLMPLLVVVCLSIANIFTDVFFSIDAENLYHRTNLFLVSTLLSVMYIVYVIVITIIQYKNIGKELAVPLLSFMILPVVGLTLQFCFYGLFMLWVSVSMSVIIIFNHVQNDYSITDWLTGLYNRKHLDNYLQQMCKRKRNDLIVGLMIDIDDFKLINDTYGHLVGDKALQETAAILRYAVGNNAYVARYAGDEFVVILQLSDALEMNETIDKIHSEIDRFNAASKEVYKISLSIGHTEFKGQNEETEDEFLSRMDSEMYAVKAQRRQ